MYILVAQRFVLVTQFCPVFLKIFIWGSDININNKRSILKRRGSINDTEEMHPVTYVETSEVKIKKW
jgi:hypothetical protein